MGNKIGKSCQHFQLFARIPGVGELTGTHTDYLLQLFYSQIESDHRTRAASLLKLLSLYLPAGEIDRLRGQIGKPLNPILVREREIRQIVKKRRIKHLVHFTRASNICSIFEHGLIPRQALQKQLGRQAGSVKVNDPYRYDNCLDANCLSISFPNYRMFYRYQKARPFTQWAVLLIRAEVLWKMDCAFCKTNAASANISSTPVEELKSSSTLAELFGDYEDESLSIARSSLSIPDYFATNPQAEVLVFDTIPAENITTVFLRNWDESTALWSASWGNRVPVKYGSDYFRPRFDFEDWQNQTAA